MTNATPTDDLAPQAPRPVRSRRQRMVPVGIGISVVVAVVALVASLVGGSLFFYNADEAVARRVDLGDERFTLQGAPIGCSITEGFNGEDPVVAFSVTFGGETVDIVHFGDPADLFQPDVPVVLDGAWVKGSAPVEGFDGVAADGWYFASDRMRVKHDNDYKNDEDYDQRLAESTAATDASKTLCGT
ncbi:MAG: cytochrome c maturation protein CcmE [Acidimicrobiales bacterium]|nr:cytochrome c maturation protein CcmE [Acidimicrobiales bacterium]MDG2217367.1 cytochrome c maturation protein CcmE [Acidimicrobiales bacterium]